MKKAAWLSAIIVALVVFAAGRSRADDNLQGTFACRITSDASYEQSVILLSLFGDEPGHGIFPAPIAGVKHLVSADFYCLRPAGIVPCDCAYTIDWLSVFSSSGGVGAATIIFDPSPFNDPVCPGTHLDDWNFVAAVNSNGIVLQVADDNNGSEAEPGTGTCSTGP